MLNRLLWTSVDQSHLTETVESKTVCVWGGDTVKFAVSHDPGAKHEARVTLSEALFSPVPRAWIE